MLFDTSSPGRKRVIRVVYGVLALLFVVGFLGFGIGTSGSLGGLFDALGLTDSNGSGGGDAALQSQIDDATARFQKHPDNAGTVVTLLSLHLSQAKNKYGDDQDLNAARPDLDEALNVWEKYLKTDPKQPSVSGAGFAAQIYAVTGDYAGAARAQQILVDANPKQLQLYVQLAQLYYQDGDFANGEKTAKEAEAVAPKKQKAKVKKSFAKFESQARKQQKLAKVQAKAGGQPNAGLDSPFGSLGGSSSEPGTASP